MECPYTGKKRSVTFYYRWINGDPPLQPLVPSDIQMDHRRILGRRTMNSVDTEKYKNDAVGTTIHNAIDNRKETRKKYWGGTKNT